MDLKKTICSTKNAPSHKVFKLVFSERSPDSYQTVYLVITRKTLPQNYKLNLIFEATLKRSS